MLVVAWCVLVLAAAVTKASVLRFARSKDPTNLMTKKQTTNNNINDGALHHVKKLGTNEIEGLLQDLDQQTTATEDAEEIGSDLLSGRLIKELAIKEEIEEEEKQNLTDISSRVTPDLPPPPMLKDDSGTPGKTTARESGISYLTGEPVWIESRELQTYSGSGKHERFMFYPVTIDNENGLSS